MLDEKPGCTGEHEKGCLRLLLVTVILALILGAYGGELRAS